MEYDTLQLLENSATLKDGETVRKWDSFDQMYAATSRK